VHQASPPPHRQKRYFPCPVPAAVKFLRRGKVKEVYEVSETELEFRFTDQISVFDKVIPTLVPHKGETLCRTSAHWFRVAESMGTRTHFLRVLDRDRMRVRRVEIIPDYAKITAKTTNFLIPLEVIARYYVAGSLHDRIRKGKVSGESLGFAWGHEPKYGEPLPEPFLETTTKLEAVDRELTHEEALGISRALGASFLALYGSDRVRFDTTGMLEPVHEEEGARIYRILHPEDGGLSR